MIKKGKHSKEENKKIKITSTEKKVIIIALIGTVVVTSGFTLMQGSTKFNQETYVSKVKAETDVSISKEEFKVVNTFKNKEKQIVSVFSKKELDSKESAQLTSLILKDNKEIKENYVICIFNDENKAKELNKETYINDRNIANIYVDYIDTKSVNVSHIYNIEQEIESIPSEYKIISVKDKDNYGVTKAEVRLNEVEKPEEALAQIKVIGDKIKKENRYAYILNIKAYTNNDKNKSWQYDGNKKSVITKIQKETI